MHTHTRRLWILALAAVTAIATVARTVHAQTVVGAIGSDIKNAAGDIWGVWVSPFQGNGRDWLTAAGVVGIAAAVSPLDDDIDRFVAARPNSALWSPFKELRQGGAVFSGQTITPVAGGLWIVGLAINNQSLRDGVMGCGAAYAASSAVRTYVVYNVFERRRPDSSRTHVVVAPSPQQGDQYDIKWGSSGNNWGMQSTPGGHIANATACVSFLTHRFHMGLVEPLLYVGVAAVGVARAADRAHWTSDQVLGVLFGYAVGKEIGRRSLDRETRRRAEAGALGAAPPVAPPNHEFFVEPASGGLRAGWRATY